MENLFYFVPGMVLVAPNAMHGLVDGGNQAWLAHIFVPSITPVDPMVVGPTCLVAFFATCLCTADGYWWCPDVLGLASMGLTLINYQDSFRSIIFVLLNLSYQI